MDRVVPIAMESMERDPERTVASRWANINSAGASGNVLVIGASASDTTPDDEFKISKLDIKCK